MLVMGADLLAIASGLLLAYWIRFHSPFTNYVTVQHGYIPTAYLRVLPYACLGWFLALRFENLYRRRSRVLDYNVVRRIITGSCLALLVIIAFTFYSKAGDFSRMVSVLTFGTVISTLILNRIILHLIFRWLLLHRGSGQSRIVILGGNGIATHLCEAMLRHPEQGMLPAGLILPSSGRKPAHWPEEIPILGTADQLEALLQEHHIDEIIFAGPDVNREDIPHMLVLCERAMTEFRIVPETTELLLSGMTVETLDGIPLLGVRETPLQGWNAALKRMIDFGVAGLGLMLTSPIIGLFAFIIRLLDGHPGIFSQQRMGIDGRLFYIYKLRTMRPDAEADSGPTFASDRDPRCTRLGWALRRTHLDELPQLYNVLRGDMSLVGPRPERPYFIKQFRDNVPRYMARHKVKSGITGWAQVNGLCGLHGSIDERLKYDLYYIENWSLWLDFKILLLTLFGKVRPGPQDA
jgi:exopolysaccharide biosynthesis polyprenyl glycosylphosphotransferase